MAAPRILVVDDEQPLARILLFAFRNEGCEVEFAVDGIDCMNRISNFEPDAVLMDVMMPKLDGLETIKLLRRNRLHRHIAIVAMSAYGSQETKKAALDAGADLFIPKPFEIGNLIERVLALTPTAGAKGS